MLPLHKGLDMASQVTEPRSLTEQERALIRWMLEHAISDTAVFLSHLSRAHVVSGCDCGCASVNLQVEGLPPPTGGLKVVADFLYGDEASLCGAFVFEQNGVLAGLEVYGLAVGAPTVLPSIASLRPFETGPGLAR